MTNYRLHAIIDSDDTAGMSVYDWFDCPADDHVLDRSYTSIEEANAAARGAYRGPDVNGVAVSWETIDGTDL